MIAQPESAPTPLPWGQRGQSRDGFRIMCARPSVGRGFADRFASTSVKKHITHRAQYYASGWTRQPESKVAMNPGAAKRQKEIARQQHQKEKAEKRDQRRQEKKERGDRPVVPGEDPDIAGIIPGPQPPLF